MKNNCRHLSLHRDRDSDRYPDAPLMLSILHSAAKCLQQYL